MRFGSSLTFANKDVFRRSVIKLVEKSDNEARIAEKLGLPKRVPLQVNLDVEDKGVSNGRQPLGWFHDICVCLALSMPVAVGAGHIRVNLL